MNPNSGRIYPVLPAFTKSTYPSSWIRNNQNANFGEIGFDLKEMFRNQAAASADLVHCVKIMAKSVQEIGGQVQAIRKEQLEEKTRIDTELTGVKQRIDKIEENVRHAGSTTSRSHAPVKKIKCPLCEEEKSSTYIKMHMKNHCKRRIVLPSAQ